MENGHDSKVSRRWVLKAAGAGVGVATLGFVAVNSRITRPWTAAVTDSASQVLPPAPAMPPVQIDDEVAALLGPLLPGMPLGRGFRITAVRGVHLGAIGFLVEKGSGAAMRVDVLRHDANGPTAPATTGSMAVFVANQGRGRTRTDADHQFAATRIARLLALRESDGAKIPTLLTHRERRARHPGGIYSLDA